VNPEGRESTYRAPPGPRRLLDRKTHTPTPRPARPNNRRKNFFVTVPSSFDLRRFISLQVFPAASSHTGGIAREMRK